MSDGKSLMMVVACIAGFVFLGYSHEAAAAASFAFLLGTAFGMLDT